MILNTFRGKPGRSRHWGRKPGGRRYEPRLEALEDRRLLNAGALDPSFGNGGIVTGPMPNFQSAAVTTAVLANGDTLVLAGTQVLRLLPNGQPDPTFGTGGVVALDFPTADMAVQANGDFVVVGNTTVALDQPHQIEIERFTANGAADATFGTGGRAIFSFGSSDAASAVTFQADGKIVIVGAHDIPTNPDVWNPREDFLVVRLNANGSLDTTFGTGGATTIDFNNNADVANGVVVQADGKIVVSGSGVGPLFHPPRKLELARLNGDGSLDATFGAGGRVSATPVDDVQYPVGLAVGSDGKIVSALFVPGETVLVKFNADGSPDLTFGTGGRVIDPSLVAGALALQADGRILVAGAHSTNGNSDFALARYLPDGAPDPTFGTFGLVTTDLGTAMDSASSITVQGAGASEKILVGGSFFDGSKNLYGLARYLGSDTGGNIPVDPSFVDQVYFDLLGRHAEAAALQGWSHLLNVGLSREWVVEQIEHSPEYLGRVVNDLFQAYLGRAADAQGLAGSVSLLQSGATVEQLKAVLLGSPEYFQRAGGTNDGFLAALYRDVLGRAPDAAAARAFAAAVAQGGSRTAFAALVVTSAEADRAVVQDDYLRFLHRGADPAGLAGFTGELLAGMRDEQVVAFILASAEYQNRPTPTA